ncbi:FAD-binding and (Fe-S)-binding domain-containing protein [Halomarina oriensis]|uniref:FAD-binding protein n=1 Tax=Halomarina oriensis TaxID=671145 RepID=A0A6B0GR04_9EURY|nr:FAD-binding and (Fe-S)-binding domain-containing protein [Halomarina oriensis]MWG36029.1 FAD-binding protein [Halomarina oriensis]
MATENTRGAGRPEASARHLDVERTDVEAYRRLAADLRRVVSGDVAFDEYAQLLYATDGSIYQARPAGVVCPTDTADVQATVEVAANHDVPVLPRGAGSSLAGQAVGPGCIVLDCSRYMDRIVDVDPEARRATVQPGVVQDHLDAALEPHGLKFAPDPASSARATVGGGIGNNSTGAHSVRYGITDAYTEELKVVLSDGSLIRTRDVVLDSPEYEDIVSRDTLEADLYETVRALVEENEADIAERYPKLKRSVSGYNLHKVVREADDADGDHVVNLSKLFVGAEGTLGVVVEATVSLVTRPEETALAMYCFDDLIDALAAVPEALTYDVGAVELMDDEVFRLAAESDGFAEYVEQVPEGTAAALLLEFDSELTEPDPTAETEDPDDEQVSPQRRAFEAAIAETTTHFVAGDDGETDDGSDNRTASGDAFEVVEAYTEAAQSDIWKLRKAAIPLLMSLEGDPKPYPFIEDATVPPEHLAAYVQEFEAVLDDHGTSAAYFAHAGSGTLHIRPILNLKTEGGVEALHSITEDVTDLVLEYHGAFSGEHGDGMARTEFSPKMYGPALWDAFKQLKTAFDPDWLFHPGNVVYRDGPEDVGPDSERGVGADNRDHLRYGAEYQSIEPRTALDFDDDGGFSHLVELCNGCGTCRQTRSDVMCPTYRASREEVQTTRGRANMLRAAISGELPEDELYSDRFQSEVLDLCVGCKGCASDCPTGVDLAKLKAEVKHHYHEREGAGLRERLFADVDTLSRVGSSLAPLSNVAPHVPGARRAMERTVGIAADRELPTFTRHTLERWFEERGGSRVPYHETDRRVLLVPDTYTNYSYPEPGKAAVRVLEAAGCHVALPEGLAPSGRAAYSKGFLDQARDRAATNVETLAPRVRDGWDVLFVEPSDAVMYQDEYLDLLAGDDVETVAAATHGVCAYLDETGLAGEIPFPADSGSVAYHGHCNQKATNTDHHAVEALLAAGYDVDRLDSSCCGMAGSFGYEAEHYGLSQAIGDVLFGQVDDSPADRVCAPGASCRSQLGDRPGETTPPHPIELLAEALEGESGALRADAATEADRSLAGAVAGLFGRVGR